MISPAVALPVTLSMLYQQPLAAVAKKLIESFYERKNATKESHCSLI
ncbi:hypothetical protein [Desulfotruncus arcticus]|nr:hypothetical protein [Desulfotruncus arcticus]